MDPDSRPELPPPAAAKVKELEDLLAAQPRAKALYLQLSQLLAEHGRKAEAIQALQRCLEIDPGNALVKHKLELLSHAGVATASATAGLHKPQAPRFVPRAAPPPRRLPVWAWVAGGAVLVGLGVAAKIWLFPGTRLVVADTFDATAPQWSPRGDRLAFLRGGTELAVHDLRQGSSQTVAKGVSGGFAWSPDGSRLAYAAEPAPGASEEDEYGYAVFVLDLGTQRATRVASGSSPSWSPDGTRLALQCAGTAPEYELSGDEPMLTRAGSPWGPCVVDVADGRPRMLPVEMAQTLVFSPERPALVYDAWSADGTEPAADAADAPERPRLNAEGNDEFQQFAQDAVSGQPRNVYEGSRDLGRRAEALMYDQKKKAARAGGSFFGTDVYVVGADGGNPVRLTQGGHAGGAHWTPDGRILFGQDSASGPQLMTMNADGSDVKPVFSKPVAIADPGSAAMTRDRKRVVFVGPVPVGNQSIASLLSGESAADLYVSRVGDPNPKRLENRHPFKQRFALSPDGKRIVYEVRNGTSGKSELWVMSL